MCRRMVLLFISLAAFVSFLRPGNLFAYQEGRIHFEASIEGLDRDIEEDNTLFLGKIIPKERITIGSLRPMGKLSVRIIDAVEVYGLVGGSDLELKDFDYSSDFGSAYGGGVRFVLFRDNSPDMPFQLFADYRFLRFKTHDRVFFLPSDNVDADGDGFLDTIPAGNPGELVNEKIQWKEHVFKLGVMGRHDEFEPYGGIRLSFVRGKDNIPSAFQSLTVDFKQSDTFGIFFGTSYYLSRSDRAALFIEASLFDQNSLTGGFRLGF